MCEIATVYQCDSRKARKEHKCCECHGIIRAGETYNHHHGIWSDGPEDYKACLTCDELRKECDKDIDFSEECTAFTMLYESVFGGRNIEIMRRFIENAQSRNAKLPGWMIERLKEAEAKGVSGV